MEDHLHVDDPAVFDLELHAGPPELGQKNGKVEAADIEASQVAGVQDLRQILGDLSKRRFVLHHVIRDAMDGCRFGGDRHLRVQSADPLVHVSLGRNTYDGELDDAVARQAQAGGFQVEEGDRSLQLEGQLQHAGLPLAANDRRRGGTVTTAHTASSSMKPMRWSTMATQASKRAPARLARL